MKRRWTGFLAAVVMLVSSCLPVLSADVAGGGKTAELTICYYAGETDNKMAAALCVISGRKAGIFARENR